MIPKETEEEKAEEVSLSSLPDEITENCLARISKWEYPELSLISKRFLSILSSPELYATRSLIGTTEPCLYFCLGNSKRQSPNWYTLWMEPADDTEDEIDDDYYSLVSVRSSSHEPSFYSTVAVGSDIYVIGGRFDAGPSSAVSILDCRSHTWRDGPSMLVARKGADAVYLDEKIYVMGGCGKDDIWMEVFDIKAQAWRPLPSPGAAKFCDCETWFLPNVLEGRIYIMAHMEDYAYHPSEGTWEVVETHSCYGHIDHWCVIENVMYCYTNSGCCMWYDSKSKEWIMVQGSDLEFLRTHSTCGLAFGCVVRLLNYGGKLLVMWIPSFEEYRAKPERRIWCSTIVLEKCHGGEVWGKIEWYNTVLTVHESDTLLCCEAISI